MTDVSVSLKVQNYKCFGETPEGFDVIKPINVIIGRNNSGKSALIDLVREACNTSPQFRHEDSPPTGATAIQWRTTITEPLARGVFREEASGGAITGSHWTVGRHYVGKTIVWIQPNRTERNARRLVSISEDLIRLYAAPGAGGGKAERERQLVVSTPNPFEGKRFRRIAAERNVQPETESGNLEPQPDGQNVTNIIQSYFHQAGLDRDLVEVTLLQQLNDVIKPDYSFGAIVPRKIASGQWEIFLRLEAARDLVPLSASGSGLKTIFCVLANMILWPKHDQSRSLSTYVFGFEELENSLHPALLRRLLQYISKRIKADGSHLFLTTHSSVVIDMFAGDPDAQIVHTTHSPGQAARAKTVSEYLHRRGILDDLDIRASDLLQSNGIIWVEGPSDRTYITHWIKLHSQGRLREGTHYQCVFYGGKLLSHLSGDEPDAEGREAFLSVLRVNRHAAIVIDSDKRNAADAINATKQRFVEEIERMEGFSWVTSGREIENYLPPEVIARCAGIDNALTLEAFDDLGERLDAIDPGSGRRFERSKAQFAACAVVCISLEAQRPILDWQQKIHDLCVHITRWNRLPEES